MDSLPARDEVVSAGADILRGEVLDADAEQVRIQTGSNGEPVVIPLTGVSRIQFAAGQLYLPPVDPGEARVQLRGATGPLTLSLLRLDAEGLTGRNGNWLEDLDIPAAEIESIRFHPDPPPPAENPSALFRVE
jgi:hypothetical protein